MNKKLSQYENDVMINKLKEINEDGLSLNK